MSEGGKQQRYKNFCVSGHKRRQAAGGESTSIRPENRRHPEIRASRDPADTEEQKSHHDSSGDKREKKKRREERY